jgi:hypothetical protein
MISAFITGAPSFQRGNGDPWKGSFAGTVIPYPLKWLDGTGRPVKIKVGAIVNNGENLSVSWSDYPDPIPPVPQKIVAYNAQLHTAVTGVINSSTASFTTLKTLSGNLSAWTHVVGGSSNVLFYNTTTGEAALSQVDSVGNLTTSFYRGRGSFAAGWTSIVFHKGYYLFYNSASGQAAVGSFSNTDFRTYNGSIFLGSGWTNILSTPNGLLFYDATNGSGAVGDWSYVTSGPSGLVSEVDFRQLKLYLPGSFLTGWTNVVNTSNGILFYCSINGKVAMTDVHSDGSVTTRPGTQNTITTGWSNIASDNDDILFYNAANGNVGIGAIVKAGQYATYTSGPSVPVPGSFAMRRIWPNYFSLGWTNIVSAVSPQTP